MSPAVLKPHKQKRKENYLEHYARTGGRMSLSNALALTIIMTKRKDKYIRPDLFGELEKPKPKPQAGWEGKETRAGDKRPPIVQIGFQIQKQGQNPPALAGPIAEALHGIEEHYIQTACDKYLDERIGSILGEMYSRKENE